MGKAALYAMFVDLAGREAVVVGGGTVAERKVEALLGSGAVVTVVSPAVTERLAALGQEGEIGVVGREFRRGDLEGAWLVIAACGRGDVNEAIRREAEERRIFCNVVDEPERCTFQAPAVVRRGRLQIAVSTGGISPALAQRTRDELAGQYGKEYERLLTDLGALRAEVKRKYGHDPEKRAAILEGFARSEAVELLRRGDESGYELVLRYWRGQ